MIIGIENKSKIWKDTHKKQDRMRAITVLMCFLTFGAIATAFKLPSFWFVAGFMIFICLWCLKQMNDLQRKLNRIRLGV